MNLSNLVPCLGIAIEKCRILSSSGKDPESLKRLVVLRLCPSVHRSSSIRLSLPSPPYSTVVLSPHWVGDENAQEELDEFEHSKTTLI